MQTLTLRRYIFRHSTFSRLPEAQQLFFIRMALVSDDLRHLHHLMLLAKVAMNATKGIERLMALHQLMFALRIYYGTLNEAWEVVRTGWHGTELSRHLHSSLSLDAKNAFERLGRYFSHDNLTTNIRKKFAFHFSDEPIKKALEHYPTDAMDDFISGEDSANTYYNFAEQIRLNALVLEACGEVDWAAADQVIKAIKQIYDEGLARFGDFTAFFDDVMVTIAKQLNATSEAFIPSLVGDIASATPILFVDRDSISSIPQS